MGLGFVELVVIAVVALVLLGPQKLPEVLKQLGRAYVQLRRTSMDFKSAFDHVVNQAEEEVRIDEIKRLTQLAKEQSAIIEKNLQSSIQGGGVLAASAETQHLNAETQESLTRAEGQTDQPAGRSELASQVFDNPQPVVSKPEALSLENNEPLPTPRDPQS